MLNILYVLSSKLNYDLMVCDDAGPGYANNFKWSYTYIDSLEEHLNQGYILVIDPRLLKDECSYLLNLIKSNTTQRFILTITDPGYESCLDHPFYELLMRSVNFKNCQYLSRYQPEELIKFLELMVGKDSLLTLNYPYIRNKEINKPFSIRKNKVVFTGNLSQTLYPERYKVWKHLTRSFFRIKVDIIRHPGYPDAGMQLKHNFIRDNYIKLLSQYKFMFVSSSRCSLELLKYTECAYAGCMPVGNLPKTLPEEIKKYFFEFNFDNINRSLIKLFSIPNDEVTEMAQNYRLILASIRDPDLLASKFESFLLKGQVSHR